MSADIEAKARPRAWNGWRGKPPDLIEPRGMTMDEARQRLAELGSLPENWDGEGAPPPSADAVERAGRILTWADTNALEIADVDADVLGGIAIWLKGAAREGWIACMNNGSDTVVAGDGAQAIVGRKFGLAPGTVGTETT